MPDERSTTRLGHSRLLKPYARHPRGCWASQVTKKCRHFEQSGRVPPLFTESWWTPRGRMANSAGGTMDRRREIRDLRQAAERGESQAMVELARAYDDGEGVPENARTAYRWYLRAAELGHPDAMYAVGSSLIEGDGVEADPPAGREWLERACATDHGLAWWRLALCSAEGSGCPRDLERALRVAREGWDRAREPLCAVLLADLYGDELADDDAALSWYRVAADAGDADAMVVLGYRARFGEGVPQNLPAAVRWYRKAAELDNEVGMSNLAVCYENGEGVERDLSEAFRLRARAAELGHDASAVWLGFAYLDGTGVRADAAHGLAVLDPHTGDPEVAYDLGLRWFEGCAALDRDVEQGLRWLRAAADAGEPRATLFLGVCYWNGEGVLLDRQQAVRLYLRAARRRDDHAWWNLALAFDLGEGVARDPARAERCLRRAARLGHGRAACLLAERTLDATSGTPDERAAWEVLRTAVQEEDPDALFLAAQCTRDGRGRPADAREALRLFRLAQVRGRDARVEIGQLRRELRD